MNIQTGNIEQVIPGERKGFVAFAFSPDETQLAYTREQDKPSKLFFAICPREQKKQSMSFSLKKITRESAISIGHLQLRKLLSRLRQVITWLKQSI